MVKEKEHLSGYQARDREIADYKMYELPGTELQFRGPPVPLVEGRFLSCLGAAQTFGCYCQQSYPELLDRPGGHDVLNLGYGGAGPRFFNRHPELLEIVNRGKLAVVQVMSGRSEDNHLFASGGLEKLTRRSDGRSIGADDAWRSVLEMRYAWKRSPLARPFARRVCRAMARPALRRLVKETRENWVTSYTELLERIKIPKLLFWISRRPPEYVEIYGVGSQGGLQEVFGHYPQLVNREMVEAILPLADRYVECVTDRGLPQPLVSRFDGRPVTVDLSNDREEFRGQTWTHNNYYPSPEMQEDAARALSPVIREMI